MWKGRADGSDGEVSVGRTRVRNAEEAQTMETETGGVPYQHDALDPPMT